MTTSYECGYCHKEITTENHRCTGRVSLETQLDRIEKMLFELKCTTETAWDAMRKFQDNQGPKAVQIPRGDWGERKQDE
jgi:hypothetical protein